jgi:hypothetical protein
MINCLHFVKFDGYNNRSDTNLKISELENGGESINTLHFLLQIISPTASFIIVLDFPVNLYNVYTRCPT